MPAEVTSIARLKTLARRRRVNRQLALWDELEAMQLMPPSLRPWVEVPVLERETLKELQAEPIAALGEMDRRLGRG